MQCVALGTASQGLAGRGALVPPPPPPEGGATPHDVTSQHARHDPVPGQNAFFAEHDDARPVGAHLRGGRPAGEGGGGAHRRGAHLATCKRTREHVTELRARCQRPRVRAAAPPTRAQRCRRKGWPGGREGLCCRGPEGRPVSPWCSPPAHGQRRQGGQEGRGTFFCFLLLQTWLKSLHYKRKTNYCLWKKKRLFAKT